MKRRILVSATMIMFLVGVVAAAEIQGVIKKIDVEKKTITLTVESGDEKSIVVAKDAEIYSQAKGKNNKAGPKQPITGGLGGVKEGANVTVTTVKTGDKETAIAVRVDGAAKKKKKDK